MPKREYKRMTREVVMGIMHLVGDCLLTEAEACARIGVNNSAFSKWKTRYQNNEWVQERLAIMRGRKIEKLVNRIEKSAMGKDVKPDWRAAAYMLERVAPERFGTKQVETTTNTNMNVQVMLDSVRRVFATTPAETPCVTVQPLLPAPGANVPDAEIVEPKPKRTIPKRKLKNSEILNDQSFKKLKSDMSGML
jgi:hypothetical protein